MKRKIDLTQRCTLFFSFLHGRRCKTRSFLGDVNAASAINFPVGEGNSKSFRFKRRRVAERGGRRRGHELCMKASIRGLSERATRGSSVYSSS